MDNKTKAAQEAAGAKTAPTASAAAQPAKTAAPAAPKQKTLAELIEERTEQVRKQAELADNREVLLSMQKQLLSIAQGMDKDLKSGSFITETVRLNISVGKGYHDEEKLQITNPCLIAGFIERLCVDIDRKITDIEKQLVA